MIFMGKRSTAHTDRKKEDRKPRIEDQFADKPTAQADSDRLDFKRIVSFLADFISDDDKRRTITTIGIYGEWGSGKTSFLKMLDERLRNEKQIYPIWFYAWRYDKQDDLWAALLQSILNQAGKLKGQNLLRKWWIKFRIWFRYKSLGEGTWEVTRKFMLGGLRIFVILIILFVLFYITFGVGGPSIATFLQMIPFLKTVPSNVLILIVNAFLVFLGAATADVGKIRDLLVGGIQVDFTKFERKSNFRDRISLLDEFSRELQDLIDLLRPPKKPLVVIIDDLDRCLPESALRVLESIKVFLENSNCIFLLGLDKQVLERAVAERYKESSSTDHNQPDTRSGMDAHQRKYHLEYFDKIIPLAIAVPQMLQTQNAIKDFITKLNSGIDKEVEEYADIFGFSLSTNPRKIKRTLSSFRFVRDLVNARIEAQEASNAEKNIRFSLLAKLITIQSQFPDLYESAIREPSLLEDLETHFRNPDLQTSEKAAYAESYANKYQGLREILIRGKNKDKEDSFVGQSIHNYAFQIGTLAEVGLSVRKQSLQNEIFWKIPGRNELFTAREVILHSLRDTFEQRLESHNACIALSGSYGIGKTQIAIEYAHRYRQDYKAVFWVHAETRNMMMIDYGAIAEYVELPEKNEQNQNLVNEAVKTWFERQTNWLLILDGVDDLSQVNDLLPHLS
ncbi:MAG TPA: P-loop NTPase fold protein, partial [Ktedonobacteraceae bacterium]|nr:P-loop NTPase fold protein [Ktedonobacteraceae bacterium]